MPLPKRKHCHARTRKRRSHNALKAPTLTECRQCRQPKRPHVVCPNCGYYGGRLVVQVEES